MKVVYGEVVKEDVVVRVVVDFRVVNGRNGGGCYVTFFFIFWFRDRRIFGGIVGSFFSF